MWAQPSHKCLNKFFVPVPQRDWYAPIVADAEAGFGGPLNCFELMKAMIKSGAAGVHFEDQLSSEKKCGHLGGKVRRVSCFWCAVMKRSVTGIAMYPKLLRVLVTSGCAACVSTSSTGFCQVQPQWCYTCLGGWMSWDLACQLGLVKTSLHRQRLTESVPISARAQVLIPTSQFLRSLVAARLAADVSGVPTVLIARTDAHSATLLTADVDEVDRAFIDPAQPRTPEGFHQFHGGIKVRAQRWVRLHALQWA